MKEKLNSLIKPMSENTAADLAIITWEIQQHAERLRKMMFDGVEEDIRRMVKEENEALEKSILSGGSVIFFDPIHKTKHAAHTIEEYIDSKCRMSIPYTRRFFIDEDGVLVKTIEPMG